MTPADLLDAYADVLRHLRSGDDTMADYMQYIMERDWALNRKRGQFYPVIRTAPGYRLDEGRYFAQTLGTQLVNAPVYQVTADMCQVIEQMWPNTDGPAVIRQAALPSPAGFAWLDQPLLMETVEDGYALQAVAVSWSTVSVRTREGFFPGIRLTLWQHVKQLQIADAETIADINVKLGPLTVLHTDMLQLDLPPGINGVGHPQDKRAIGSMERLLKYLSMMWTLLGMDLADVDKAEGTRGVRRRNSDVIGTSDVLVVTLRKHRAARGEAAGQRDVNWSHRWIVFGFWRHGYGHAPADGHHAAPGPDNRHCAVCEAPAQWIDDFIKGPPGTPIITRRRLHKLAR